MNHEIMFQDSEQCNSTVDNRQANLYIRQWTVIDYCADILLAINLIICIGIHAIILNRQFSEKGKTGSPFPSRITLVSDRQSSYANRDKTSRDGVEYGLAKLSSIRSSASTSCR